MVDIQRAGQIVDDTVEKHLHAFVLERSATEHRADVETQGLLADLVDQFLLSDAVGVVHELLKQGLIVLGGAFDEHGTVFLNLFFHVLGNRHLFIMRPIVFLFPHISLVLDQVDDAHEGVLNADGKLDRDGVAVQAFTDLVHDLEIIGTRAIHLVHKAYARHIVLVSLTPNGLRLRLDATHGTENGDGTIKDAQ